MATTLTDSSGSFVSFDLARQHQPATQTDSRGLSLEQTSERDVYAKVSWMA